MESWVGDWSDETIRANDRKRASVSLGGLLAVIFIQLGIVLGPLALGVVGLISGGTAGLASIGAWFLLGIPLSYSAIDIWSTRRVRKPSPQNQFRSATPDRLYAGPTAGLAARTTTRRHHDTISV